MAEWSLKIWHKFLILFFKKQRLFIICARFLQQMVNLFYLKLLWMQICVVNIFFYCRFLLYNIIIFTIKFSDLSFELNFLLMESFGDMVFFVVIIVTFDFCLWHKLTVLFYLLWYSNVCTHKIPDDFLDFGHLHHPFVFPKLHLLGLKRDASSTLSWLLDTVEDWLLGSSDDWVGSSVVELLSPLIGW